MHDRDYDVGKAAKGFLSLLQELEKRNHPIHRQRFFYGAILCLGSTLTRYIAFFALGPLPFENQEL